MSQHQCDRCHQWYGSHSEECRRYHIDTMSGFPATLPPEEDCECTECRLLIHEAVVKSNRKKREVVHNQTQEKYRKMLEE